MEPKKLCNLYPRVGIAGIGDCIPPLRLKNEDLEKMVETTNEWIIDRVGIKERSIAPEHYNIYTMGSAAALEAIENANLKVKDINAIIVGHNYTDELLVPSASCVIQHLIGANKVSAMDVSAGCSGGIYALETAIDKMYTTYFANGNKELNILVGAVDKLSNVVNWKDRNTCVLLSDSAAFQVLKFFDKGGFLSIYTDADGTLGNTISYKSGFNNQLINENPPRFSNEMITKKGFFKMDGRAVYKFAVKKMPETTKKVWDAAGYKLEDLNKIKRLIPHQANLRIIEESARRLGIDPEKVHTKGVEYYGNSSAASVLNSLSYEYKVGNLEEKDLVILVAFGAGVTSGGAVIEWNKPKYQGISNNQEPLVKDLYKEYKNYTKDI